MFRRALFWGLTIMLVAVIVSLMIRSRSEEKRQAAATAEVVRQFKPTATRVIRPRDLVIVESNMGFLPTAQKGQTGLTDRQQVVVRNEGPLAYADVRLEFTYVGRGEKTLETRTIVVSKPIPPMQTESLGDITIEGIPAGAVSCRTRILYADLSQ
jgi:hypothetical protein